MSHEQIREQDDDELRAGKLIAEATDSDLIAELRARAACLALYYSPSTSACTYRTCFVGTIEALGGAAILRSHIMRALRHAEERIPSESDDEEEEP